jgi:SAM-dependent methyltransferase
VENFKNYYRSEDITGSYDKIRFSSRGGIYIDQRERDAVLTGLPNPSAGRILEIGCGTGRLTLTLLERGYSVLSIDPSAGMLNKARAKLDQLPEHVRERVELQMGSGFELSGLPQGFAGAVSLRVFIHLSLNEVGQMLREIGSRLKTEGIFCFDTLSLWSPNVTIRPLNWIKAGYPKNTFLVNSQLKRVIADSGFEIIRLDPLFVVPQFLIRVCGPFAAPLIGMNNLLERVCKPIGGHVFWTLRRK